MPLVTAVEVGKFLQRTVPADTAEMAVSIAEGWLRPLVRSVAWPPSREEHPDLWAAAVELAAMAVDNPTSMRSSAVGGQTDEWSVARRTEILADVASRYGAVAPIGSFPAPAAWPGEQA